MRRRHSFAAEMHRQIAEDAKAESVSRRLLERERQARQQQQAQQDQALSPESLGKNVVVEKVLVKDNIPEISKLARNAWAARKLIDDAGGDASSEQHQNKLNDTLTAAFRRWALSCGGTRATIAKLQEAGKAACVRAHPKQTCNRMGAGGGGSTAHPNVHQL
jgi:hypothetical protein